MGAMKELSMDIEERGVTDAGDVYQYITGGRGAFTLLSLTTGTRFTYKISTTKNRHPFFVSLLTRPDNETGYEYLGTIFNTDGTLVYRSTPKSRIAAGAQSNKAISWFLTAINKGVMPEQVAFFHEGRCGRCGRKLTTPESIKRGLGPHCANIED